MSVPLPKQDCLSMIYYVFKCDVQSNSKLFSWSVTVSIISLDTPAIFCNVSQISLGFISFHSHNNNLHSLLSPCTDTSQLLIELTKLHQCDHFSWPLRLWNNSALITNSQAFSSGLHWFTLRQNLLPIKVINCYYFCIFLTLLCSSMWHYFHFHYPSHICKPVPLMWGDLPQDTILPCTSWAQLYFTFLELCTLSNRIFLAL